MPTDLDLRKLRYFVAVAEELNFGRAAERLRIAQPVLSRQIRALEDDLHITLLNRGSHGTALTDAGRQLLMDAHIVLDDAALIRRRLARFRHADLELTVGVMPGLLATRAISDFQDAVPGCRVSVVRLGWSTQVERVRSGAVDVAYARDLPELAGMVVHDLLDEPRDVVLPRAHRLSTRDVLSPQDLSDELLLQDSAVAPEWLATATAARRNDASRGAAADSVEEKLELVAAGRGFVVLPHSTTAAYRRPDVIVVPSSGFRPSRVSLLWRGEERDDLRDRFVASAIAQAEAALAG